MHIREATAEDWPAIWPVFRKIVAAGDTYTYPPDMAEADARACWMQPAPYRTVVVLDEAGTVIGTARMNRNHQGPGSHVANAGYMVDPAHAGQGIGRALCEYSLDWARAEGYRIMQFNAVAETNVHAIRLYRSLGFEITGTLPGGFRHPARGYIALHIMHKIL
ncbi:GNAT family N-acetyltransferase [Streptomyces aidingensis]|nr:GNAT family N-acetyltransferase [Streptomyces aidingensis]